MRCSFVLIILTTSIFFGCKKPPFEDPALEGTWKMIEVRDNSEDSIISKPSSVTEDVVIVFSYSAPGKGKMWGHTTTALVRGNFTAGEHKTISMPAIYFDYSGMDMIGGSVEWDNEFGNITISKDYSLDSNGHLNINTTNNKSLVFERQ